MNISLHQLIKWLILTLLFPLVFLNGWLVFRLFQYFQPLVTIFVLAALLAFILNYPVSLLQQRGIKRNYAVALVFFVNLLLLVTVGIILLPIALEQFNDIAKLLPQWIDSSQEKIKNLNDLFISEKLHIDLGEILTRITDKIPDELENISDKFVTIVIDTIDSLSEALVTIVLAFYFLLDGERIGENIFNKSPWAFVKKLREPIQNNLQNYLIGQGTLALLIGTLQTLMFLVFQVQFGLLFGLGIGIFSLIPFGDVVSLIVITLIIASHDFWLALKVLAVAVIIDQIIDQAIAPRLLGSLTGVRPVWVLVSLLLGTYVAGLLGLLVAVPVAGLIKDIIDDWESLSGQTDEGIGDR
ncbi:AI-2E family transporter [Anabaena sp. UHCC 0399]|uniref:AI-2E family transporter n=1 Tax=Anabaena sp. UHCC 0399 TaxID=3110238 RepID=UPI002B20762A|nr:AI-2E family transporter [Anabaena sp. UHCC 0399]MEA5565708.1 AI-2E family transporter [Anabaena sp. UHCC 0399]